ncbi:MAG: DUF1203 domain-containing protein [Sphingobacteriales bacterium]|nr:DUF1203 domain-containing protein [Sphingobacteriales bacterium]
MDNFIIRPIGNGYQQFFNMNREELLQLGVQLKTVTEKPGFPCRISLEDAEIGEEVLLMSYVHHATSASYLSSGPVYIRRNAKPAQLAAGEVPGFLLVRYLSLRCYNREGEMVDATLCAGTELKQKLGFLFLNPEIIKIDIHNAKPGCFNCVAEKI